MISPFGTTGEWSYAAGSQALLAHHADDRSVFHTPTFDYDGLGERYGNRAVGIGEVPYLDPYSKSRTEDLYGAV
jgi:hypothetical protein